MVRIGITVFPLVVRKGIIYMRILSEISQCRRFSSHGLSRRRNGALRKELSNLRYSFQGY